MSGEPLGYPLIRASWLRKGQTFAIQAPGMNEYHLNWLKAYDIKEGFDGEMPLVHVKITPGEWVSYLAQDGVITFDASAKIVLKDK